MPASYTSGQSSYPRGHPTPEVGALGGSPMECRVVGEQTRLRTFIPTSWNGPSGAARNFVREGPVTDVVRVQSLAILHEDHFNVTAQFLV